MTQMAVKCVKNVNLPLEKFDISLQLYFFAELN